MLAGETGSTVLWMDLDQEAPQDILAVASGPPRGSPKSGDKAVDENGTYGTGEKGVCQNCANGSWGDKAVYENVAYEKGNYQSRASGGRGLVGAL